MFGITKHSGQLALKASLDRVEVELCDRYFELPIYIYILSSGLRLSLLADVAMAAAECLWARCLAKPGVP